MSYAQQSMNQDSDSTEWTQKLMANAFVCPESSCTLSAEVKRGMPILSNEGLEVGKVAAVILNGENHKATHILLCRLPEVSGYWLVSVDLIKEIRDKRVQLSISGQAVESLPRWHST
jgi:sporulation protein YlmC with PRC-barrel domain